MRVRKGPWDGAQPRSHVLMVLRKHGVTTTSIDDDWYELVDADGDPLVLRIENPVLADMVVLLWQRFGTLHGFDITALVRRH